ncbi:MAG: LppX_LprAFG lipoprotein [Microthrixaceae bacterium]
MAIAQHPRHRLIAAIALSTLALTACGNDKTSSADKQGSTTVAGKAGAPTTAGTTERVTGEDVDKTEFMKRLTDSVKHYTTAHTTMSMSMSGQDITVNGEVDYRTTPASMAMTMKSAVAGGDTEIILVDGMMYMKMASLGDKYMKLSVADGASAMGSMTEITDSMDPVNAMKSMSDAVTVVKLVGEDTVDGAATKHYAMVIDSAKLTAGIGSAGSGSVPKQVTYNLWLDDQDRIRKTEMDLGTVGKVTMTLDRLGEPVTIAAPPADQISEMSIPNMPTGSTPGSK